MNFGGLECIAEDLILNLVGNLAIRVPALKHSTMLPMDNDAYL